MRPSNPEQDGIQAEPPSHSGPHAMSRREAEDESPSIARERSTAFFGRVVRERQSLPLFPIAMLLLAALMGVLANQFSLLELFLGAGLPAIALGLVLWLTRTPVLAVRFSEEGIRFEPSGYSVPYGQIEEIFAPGRRTTGQFDILLLCDGGHIVLPKKIEVDSDELHAFLATQPLGRPAIPDDIDPMFHAFLRQQIAVHGADKIMVYRRPAWNQRQRIRTSWRDNLWLRVFLAFSVMGLFWLAAFAIFFNRPSMLFLLALGIFAPVMGLIFLGASLLQRAQEQGPKKLRNAMLIVTPSGLALSQGDLKGELRWREIQKLKLQKNAIGGAGTTAGAGVLITVAGAALIIADLYHWPAEHIEWLIRAHSGQESP